MEQHAAILKEVKTVSKELEAIAASVLSVSVGRSKSAEDTIVKLEKLKYPKFSETPRDYSRFNRDFNQIVNLAGRSDVEIGSNIKDAIPKTKRFRHLVTHLNIADHEEMINVLDRKF